jgi:hypothetical protein
VSDDPIESAWHEVLAQWEDERAHKAFVLLASSTGCLAEAGRRYREVQESDPARADVAKRETDRILALALQGLTTLKSEPPRTSKALLMAIAFAVMSALIISALWAVLRMR